MNAVASLVPCSDPRTPPSDPAQFADVAGTLFFTANDGVHGRALWKSNGTKAGTVLVRSLPSSGDEDDVYDAGPSDLTGVGGTLFFTYDDGVHGRGTVEVQRDEGGHGPGQGHRPRKRLRQ